MGRFNRKRIKRIRTDMDTSLNPVPQQCAPHRENNKPDTRGIFDSEAGKSFAEVRRETLRIKYRPDLESLALQPVVPGFFIYFTVLHVLPTGQYLLTVSHFPPCLAKVAARRGTAHDQQLHL